MNPYTCAECDGPFNGRSYSLIVNHDENRKPIRADWCESCVRRLGLTPCKHGLVATACAKCRKNRARQERDQAMRDLGLKRVRGALGGVYWE